MRNKLSLAINLAVAASIGLAATQAIAYEAGDMILRAGVAHVNPNDDSSDLNINGSDFSNTEAQVDSGTALGNTFTYMLSSNLGIELLASTPFEHDIDAKLTGFNAALGTVNAGSAKHLPPTLSLQWYFQEASSEFQPYVGVGVNHTLFFEEDLDSELVGILGAGKLDLDSSWGGSVQAGFDYTVNENWVVNAALWYIDISTDATINFNSGTVVKADVDIDPMVYMMSLGYKF